MLNRRKNQYSKIRWIMVVATFHDQSYPLLADIHIDGLTLNVKKAFQLKEVINIQFSNMSVLD